MRKQPTSSRPKVEVWLSTRHAVRPYRSTDKCKRSASSKGKTSSTLLKPCLGQRASQFHSKPPHILDSNSLTKIPCVVFLYSEVEWNVPAITQHICAYNVCMYAPIYIYISIYLYIYISIYLYIYISIYLHIYISTYLDIYISTYLYIYIYICFLCVQLGVSESCRCSLLSMVIAPCGGL